MVCFQYCLKRRALIETISEKLKNKDVIFNKFIVNTLEAIGTYYLIF